jgi:hypothetical protein
MEKQQHDCVQVDAIKATQIDVAVLKTNNVTMTNDAGYLTSFTEIDPVYTSDKSNIVFQNDDISRLTNDVGYITDYTVTEGDVTQYESSLTITESQISDLQEYYLASNPDGFISGINSTDVTTALGFTPENSANKGQNNGYAGLDAGKTFLLRPKPVYEYYSKIYEGIRGD